MKKLIFMLLVVLLTSALEIWSYTVKPRMTKTVEPHYSGISGRRYYFPKEYEHDEPLVVTVDSIYGNYLNYNITQSAEDIAREINRRKRVEQLQRSSKKPEGVSSQGEIVGVPSDFAYEYTPLK
jgi:hypothetical protein